ncbi:hypothetical protein AAC387_Pa11g0281 [Persea americana]
MLNIAIGVAFALDYLHHHYQMLVVHCDLNPNNILLDNDMIVHVGDLKPNNILLDNDMIVHVGDFGQAKFLLQPTSDASHDQTNSIAIKGSIGYVAPEYGMGGEASTQGEMFTVIGSFYWKWSQERAILMTCLKTT